MRRTSGISLMLLIFLSLCLIIFSLLSLSGAVADETLSTQAADRTSEYYAAVTEANARLAGIDRQLTGCLREAQGAADTGTQGTAAAGDTQDTAGSDTQGLAAAGDTQDTAGSDTQGPAATGDTHTQDTAGSDTQGPAAAGAQNAASADSTQNPAAADAQDTYLQLCGRIGDALPGVTWSDGLLSFSVGVDEDQILQVEVEPVWPSSDTDPLYRIRTWKIVNTGEWTADRTMHLFRTGQ